MQTAERCADRAAFERDAAQEAVTRPGNGEVEDFKAHEPLAEGRDQGNALLGPCGRT